MLTPKDATTVATQCEPKWVPEDDTHNSMERDDSNTDNEQCHINDGKPPNQQKQHTEISQHAQKKAPQKQSISKL